MNLRERRLVIESGGIPDRFPVHGVHPWRQTLLRWKQEGMPDVSHPNQALGLDQDYDTVMLPLNLGMAPLFDVVVLERDTARVTVRDEFGVVRRMPHEEYAITGGAMMLTGETSAMSEFLAYPLTDRASWETLRRDRFSDDFSLRVPSDWAHRAPQYRAMAKEKYIMARGYPIMGAIGGFRQMMGLEPFIYAMADEPDWIREMWAYLISLWKATFDRVLQDVPVDHVIFFEDMCAKHGPLISPQMYMDFFGEGYRELIAFLRERGVHLFDLDTDGNATRMLPAYLSLGVNMLSPCQASAGMDAETLLKAYPSLLLHGGIDNTVLAYGDRQEIEAEVRSKYAAAWRYGRLIPAPEHGIAHNVSWDNIRYFADACLLYSVKAP